MEDFSKKFQTHYGFNIPVHILATCLKTLVENKVIAKERDEYQILSKSSDPSFDEEAVSFTRQFELFINGFIDFSKPDQITVETASALLDDFCRQNEVNPSTFLSDFDTTGSPVGTKYKLSRYIRQLHDSKDPLFPFLVSLCEAHLVKNYICQTLDTSSCRGKIIYLDTPIILRLLGYCGEYYEEEYKGLLETLKKYGNTFKIFQNTDQEIVSILRDSQFILSNLTGEPFFNAGQVAYYFLNKEFSKEDIELEINTLPQKLNELGIVIDYADVDYQGNARYVHLETEIKEAIIKQYSNGGQQTPTAKEGAIDCDVKSIEEIYIKRKDNDVLRFSGLGVFFLTSNSGLFKAVRTFNQAKHPGTLSPVVHDSYLGMIVSAENMVASNKLMEGRVLGYCYSAYRPSSAMLRRYVELLINQYKSKKISKEDYALMRAGSMSGDFLVNATSNDPAELTESTMQDILASQKEFLVRKESEEHQKEISDLRESHSKEIEEINSKNSETITTLKKENEKQLCEKDKQYRGRIIPIAQNDFDSWRNSWKRLDIFIAVILVLATLILLVFSIVGFFIQYPLWKVLVLAVSAVITTALSVFSIIRLFVKREWMEKRTIKKKKELAKKYGIDQLDIN